MNVALGDMVLDYIDARYSPLRFATERLARVTGATPASARNWLRRVCRPQVDNIGELIKNDPEFREKLRFWIEKHEGKS